MFCWVSIPSIKVVVDLVQSLFLFGKLHSCLSDLKIALDKITCNQFWNYIWDICHIVNLNMYNLNFSSWSLCRGAIESEYICRLYQVVGKSELATNIKKGQREKSYPKRCCTWSTSHSPHPFAPLSFLKWATTSFIPVGPPACAEWIISNCDEWMICLTPLESRSLSCLSSLLPSLQWVPWENYPLCSSCGRTLNKTFINENASGTGYALL